jgi:predicted DNA-binding transcriptional regulator YafY
MTQIERLMMLLDALPQRRQAVTAKQLFESHPWKVDLRTLQRDLNLLEELDLAERRAPIPDDFEDSRSERWCAISRNSPFRARLSTEQAIALDLIERLSKSLLPATVVRALRDEFAEARRHLQMQRNVDARTRWADKVEVLPEGFSATPNDTDARILQRLQQALLTDRRVEARYRALARGKSKKRQLEPRALVQRGSTLYIIATRADKTPSDPHWYAVHRFLSVRVLKSRCDASPFHLREFLAKGGGDFGSSGAPITFKARVSKELKRALDTAPLSADMKIRPANGGGIITATVPRSWTFQRWLLSRGPDLEVLEPADLREYMRSQLQAALAGYAPATASGA